MHTQAAVQGRPEGKMAVDVLALDVKNEPVGELLRVAAREARPSLRMSPFLSSRPWKLMSCLTSRPSWKTGG
jgi:hypothetical protein